MDYVQSIPFIPGVPTPRKDSLWGGSQTIIDYINHLKSFFQEKAGEIASQLRIIAKVGDLEDYTEEIEQINNNMTSLFMQSEKTRNFLNLIFEEVAKCREQDSINEGSTGILFPPLLTKWSGETDKFYGVGIRITKNYNPGSCSSYIGEIEEGQLHGSGVRKYLDFLSIGDWQAKKPAGYQLVPLANGEFYAGRASGFSRKPVQFGNGYVVMPKFAAVTEGGNTSDLSGKIEWISDSIRVYKEGKKLICELGAVTERGAAIRFIPEKNTLECGVFKKDRTLKDGYKISPQGCASPQAYNIAIYQNGGIVGYSDMVPRLDSDFKKIYDTLPQPSSS